MVNINYLIAAVPAIIIIWLAIKPRALDPQTQHGLNAENKTLQSLMKLPNEFILFNNLDIPCERSGKNHETDMIVLGKNSVFVVEIKGNVGQIFCQENESDWKVTKTTFRGTEYEKTLRNPIIQAKSRVNDLLKFFKTHGSSPWVQGVVYFADDRAELYELNTLSGKVPVLKNEADLLKFISTFQPERKPTGAKMKNAKSCLLKLRSVTIASHKQRQSQ